jgi:predicted DNA-binding transcriptional regulator AlpA
MFDDANLTTQSPYVRIKQASAMIGLSVKAIERKIEEGIWLEGREYRRGPDKRIYISMKGFAAWVEKGSTSGQSPSKSRSLSRERSAAQPST